MYPDDTQLTYNNCQYNITQRLGYMVNNDIMPTDKPWDNAYVHAGFKTSKLKLPYNGGRKTEIEMTKSTSTGTYYSDYFSNWKFTTVADYPTINYYLALQCGENNTYPSFTKSPIRFSNPNDILPLKEWEYYKTYTYKYNSAVNNISFYNNVTLPGVLRTALVTGLDLREVMARFYFVVCSVNMSNVTVDGDIYSFSAYGSTVRNDIEAYIEGGTYYDEDLWNKGYTIKDGVLYFVTYDNNISLYVGKSNRTEFSGQGFGNFTAGRPCIIAEIAQNDNVYYSVVACHNGLNNEELVCYWDNSSALYHNKYPAANFCNSNAWTPISWVLKSDYAENPIGANTFLNPTGDFPECEIEMYTDTTSTLFKLNTSTGVIVKQVYNYYYNSRQSAIYKFYPIKDLFHIFASFGFAFTGGLNTAQYCPLGSYYDKNNTYAKYAFYPVYDSDGTTTGEWIKYSDAQPDQINRKDTSDYIPVDPKGGGGEDFPVEDFMGDGIEPNGYNSKRIRSSLNTLVTLTGTQVSIFKEQLSKSPNTFWEALSIAGSSGTSSIVDYIKSLRTYPFNIDLYTEAAHPGTNIINIGFNKNAPLNVPCLPLLENVAVIDCGTVTPKFLTNERSFLDLEPYTNASIFLPFIGTFEIDCNRIMGKACNLIYIVDYSTGMGTAILTSGVGEGYSSPILVKSAQIGVNISFAGNDIVQQSESMSHAFVSGFSKISGIVAGTTASAMNYGTGNKTMRNIESANMASQLIMAPSTAVDVGVNASLSTRSVPFSMDGGSGAGNAIAQPYFVIKRPRVDLPSNYGHVVGFVTNKVRKLSDITGFTVCSNVDTTGLNCNDDERNEIKTLLESGVYL